MAVQRSINSRALFACYPAHCPRWLSALLLALFLLVSGHALGGEAFDCRAFAAGPAPEQHRRADELLAQTWAIDRLRCAAGIRIARADAHTDDAAAQLQALQANATYSYYLDRIVLYDLGHLIVWYVNDVPSEKLVSEPMRALHAARTEQRRLLTRIRETHASLPELDFYEAQLIGAQAPALPFLERAVAADPPGLGGAAHALLGETYYDLPDMLGGSLDLAIQLMQAASARAPDNTRYLRVLAGYQLDAGNTEEARELLQQLANLEVANDGLQLQADQLRAAADLAVRMGDSELHTDLAAARNRVLQQHPYLQRRKVVSAMGHFGSNDPRQDGS